MDTPREIAEEQYIREHEGMCGTCHYWHKEEKGHSCMCLDSIFAADWVDDTDGCNRYVPKRNIHLV